MAEREHQGWSVSESGPPGVRHTILLLPGAMCTAIFFDDLLAEEKLSEIRFIATTLPGFGGTEPPGDLSIEAYARGAAELAAEFGCDVVVGHSLGANVAVEMVAGGHFSGPLVLLAPSLSRQDEATAFSVLERVGRVPVIGALAWSAMIRSLGPLMKREFPAGDRRDELVAEMKRNDPGFCRLAVRSYFEYLDRHGSVAGRLCESGVPAWVVLGADDDVTIAEHERQLLENCPHVSMVDIADAGHMTLTSEPGRVADQVAEAISSLGDGPRAQPGSDR